MNANSKPHSSATGEIPARIRPGICSSSAGNIGSTWANEDFYIDLLFYHLHLRAFIVIDLKKGKFKPEYAGKLNFYCNVINDRLKTPERPANHRPDPMPEHDHLLAEYSFAGIDKPIGISTYELTRALPKEMQSALPTVEEIEAELGKT